ncbi:MAG: I78 family peptidase inhibitor [Moraxellaceae bacterium]
MKNAEALKSPLRPPDRPENKNMRLAIKPPSTLPLLLAFALTGSLAACSTTTAAPKAAAEEPAHEIAMGCMEANAQWALGKPADEATVAKAKTDADAKAVRVIKPGTAVTMEYNGSRLNLHLNLKGMIERVSCG